MTLDEIKTATLAGRTVHWANHGYVVVFTGNEWYIVYARNGDTIGLTHKDNTTLNGDESQFFIGATQ